VFLCVPFDLGASTISSIKPHRPKKDTKKISLLYKIVGAGWLDR